MGPYILKLAKVIKYAGPVAGAAAGAYVGPIGAVMGAKYAKDLAGQIKLMEELAPDRNASEHTSRVNPPRRVNSKASELTFPCCESGEQLSGINSG
jgi:hypothetical protein